jgi:hypothetical protein
LNVFPTIVALTSVSIACLAVPARLLIPLRLPKLYVLRPDPCERTDVTSNTCYDWFMDHAYIMFGARALTTGDGETEANGRRLRGLRLSAGQRVMLVGEIERSSWDRAPVSWGQQAGNSAPFGLRDN